MSENISAIVSKNLLTIPATASVGEALGVMDERRLRHLPVTDPTGRTIIGMVTRRDLEALAADATRGIQKAVRVQLVLAKETDSLRHTILRILEEKVSSVLVVDDKHQALGIVTTDDILWQYATLLAKDDGTVQPLLSFANLQLAGAVAHQLSNAGI